MTTFHCHIDVRDALKWGDRKLSHLLQDENGDKYSGPDARLFLQGELESGRPLFAAAACDNFDPTTGCKGHPEK